MVLKGRWPRAIFYDSKTTLFDWSWTWKQAAARLVEKYQPRLSAQEFLETWIKVFEGLHRRTAFYRYTPVMALIQEALVTLYKIHDIPGSADDVEEMVKLQDKVELFAETEPALSEQQKLGVKIMIYSDVETKFLDMYVRKFKNFKPDFVGTTEQAGVHKPNPQTYFWVLRRMGLEARDVIYCAAPTFDIQGAMACGLITAWLRRPEGRLSKETHDAGLIPADYEIENLNDLTEIIKANRRT
jgi:2-haloalkanoic acid dehalogenase type II